MPEDLEIRFLQIEKTLEKMSGSIEKMSAFLQKLGYETILKERPKQQNLENLDEYNLPRISFQALEVLRTLLKNGFVMKLERITNEIKKHKMTVFGLLRRLEKYGFVEDRKGGIYAVPTEKRDWLYGKMVGDKK